MGNILWAFATSLLLTPFCLAQQSVQLVKNGVSDHLITISSTASPSERHAAEELQRFIEEMSGAKLRIVTDVMRIAGPQILVGNSSAVEALRLNLQSASLGTEGFVIKTAPPNIVIAGGRQRGTMYGVYTFLEKLGCRWFSPEASRVPRMASISVPAMDETQKPAFEYREPFFTEAFDKDWAARNKMNGNSQLLDESTGGKVQYYPFVHSFYNMLPPEKYFKDHPEYFSFIDGKRRWERGQLCLTNPDVLRLGVEAVERWIREHPEATILSVSQNDWTGWCECDNCRRIELEEGDVHSGPVLHYVNALAEQIGRKHPDKLIDTLAYWYTEPPPAKVKPRPNVRIRLCPIGVCEAHPYETCERSAYFMKNLRAWSQITNQLYIWHYNTNFAHYLMPFPDFDELAANIPMYRKHGVVGLFMEGAYPQGGGGENAELRSYVMAKLLWDTKANVDQAVTEFLQGVYGKAAPMKRAYFDLMHREVRRPPQGKGMHIWIFNVPHFSDSFIRESQALFQKAEAAADSDVVRRRVRKARLSIDYLEMLRAKTFTVRNESYAPANMEDLKTKFNALFAELRNYGIRSIREGVDLEAMEKEFADNTKPYAASTLQGGRLRVGVAPEMGGRIVSILDSQSGRDALYHADSGDRGYPNAGGWSVAAYPDYHSRQALTEKCAMTTTKSPQSVTTTATCPGGLVLRREMEIRRGEGTLYTRTTLRNSGGSAAEVALQSRIELDPGNPDRAIVEFARRDGKFNSITLIQAEREPVGNETYPGDDQPAGEVRLSNRQDGRAWIVQFPVAQVGRTLLNWSGKGTPRVSLGLWSPQKTLAPGEALVLETTLRLQ